MQEFPLCAVRTALQGVAAAVIVVAGVQTASATSNEKAVSLCQEELLDKLGASSVGDIRVRRRNHKPYVYGSADFSDGRSVQFRCRVYRDKVTSISYQEEDASAGSGTAWKRAGPPATPPSDAGAGGSGEAATPKPPAGASGGSGEAAKPAPPADGEGDAAKPTPPAEGATGPIFMPAPK
jgi:hypothetical protein